MHAVGDEFAKHRSPFAIDAIEEHPHVRQRSHFDTPFTPQIVQNRIKLAARRANVRRGVHILRHTLCSHLSMRGAPAKAIQDLAWHADLTMTHRCMHLSPAALDAAIASWRSRDASVVWARADPP